MKKILLTTTVLAFAATMATAAITSQDVVDELTAQDYTVTEVRTGATQIKVEAVKGDQKIEMVYDIETGSVLRSETRTLLNTGTSGETASYSTSGSDDNGLDDANDDNGNDNGDDNGADDNGNDDNDNGNDDNGNDDNGNDDNGNDDNGGGNDDNGGNDNDD